MPNGITEEGWRFRLARIFMILAEREKGILARQSIPPTKLCEHGDSDIENLDDIIVDNLCHKVTKCRKCGHVNVNLNGEKIGN